MRTIFLLFALATLAACSSSSSSGGGSDGGTTAADSSSSADAAASKCGHSGDQGNDVGVGKYCENFADCADTMSAHICSVIGDSTTHFCTRTCTAPPDGGDGDAAGDGGASGGDCGQGATCECSDQGCGCTPNTCL